MYTPLRIAKGNKAIKSHPYMDYEPLPEGYIRLLKIHESPNVCNTDTNPETWDLGGDIKISLISVPLNECPPYVALSYTWGYQARLWILRRLFSHTYLDVFPLNARESSFSELEI
jgi:hypothetical protein